MKKFLVFALIFLVQTAFSFPLDPVRIFLQDKSPESGQVQTEVPAKGQIQIEVSVWQGGEPKEVDSGKEIYRERRVITTTDNGEFDCWLGQGEVVFGKLKGPEFGLDKELRLQIEYQGKDTTVKRKCLLAIDNAYVAGSCDAPGENSAHLKGTYFKKYEPAFEQFSPDLVRRGLAILYPDGRLQTEDGSYVDTTGTTSSGVQEFFDYCTDHHVDGYIVGGSVPGKQQIPYVIWTPVRIKPAQGLRIDTGAISLQFMPEVGDAPGLTIDSCMMCDIRIRGIIHYMGDGYAVAIKPENTLPLDKFVGPTLVDTSIYIMTIACRGTAGAVLFENSINYCRFEFNEINHGRIGVHVAEKQSFSNNKFTCKHIHGQEEVNMLIQGGGSNVWEVNLNCDGKDPKGIVTEGADDIWFASVTSRNQPGLVIEKNARGNQFHLMTLNGGFENHAINPINRIYASAAIPADKIKLGFAAETPAVPFSSVPLVNRNPFPVLILILKEGSVNQWSITDTYGISQCIEAPLTAGQTIRLSPGESITLDYPDTPPEWKWRTIQ